MQAKGMFVCHCHYFIPLLQGPEFYIEMYRSIIRTIIDPLLPLFYCPGCLDEMNFLYIVISYKDADVMFGSMPGMGYNKQFIALI